MYNFVMETSSLDDEMLCSNLEPTIVVDEENCTLISSDVLQNGSDFDVWFTNSATDSIVSCDNIQNQISSFEADPFLNEIIQISQYDLIYEEQPKSKLESKKPAILRSVNSKTDNNMNSVHKPSKSSRQNVLKSDVLLGNRPFTVDMKFSTDVCQLFIKNSEGDEIFLPQDVQISESYQLTENRTECVIAYSLIDIADNQSVFLAQIVVRCGSKIYLCPMLNCQEAFFHVSNAKLHSLKHLGVKPYKCDKPNCPWEFYTASKLSRHKETHSQEKSFLCDYDNCSRAFTTIYNLRIHKRSHKKPATLECPVKNCTKIFQTEKQRKIHCRSHSISDAPYRCPVTHCSKSFFTHTSLQTHSRSHLHKESDLCCQYPNCKKEFDTPYRLKEHLRSHTGDRPYVCNFTGCTWSFTTASKLRRHQSIHTNDRKYHCTIGGCSKSFLRSEHLKEHTLSHIGHRPFECDVCGMSFIGRSALYVHNKKAHPNKKKECTKFETVEQSSKKKTSDVLLAQAIQSLEVPLDMMSLGTGLLPDERLELLDNENFSTVNLRDLE